MSLYGMMRTGVSGMNAQANRLSTVADNIANAGTTGYKRSKTEFSSLVMPNLANSYNSGGVNTTVMNTITQQGLLQYTTSASDLAVNGDGFFVVQNANGQTYLTRAGAFVPNADGELVKRRLTVAYIADVDKRVESLDFLHSNIDTPMVVGRARGYDFNDTAILAVSWEDGVSRNIAVEGLKRIENNIRICSRAEVALAHEVQHRVVGRAQPANALVGGAHHPVAARK